MPEVLIVRDDGVIVLVDAVPVDHETQRQINAICELLGAPPRKQPPDKTRRLPR